jgi:hypothetical protein
VIVCGQAQEAKTAPVVPFSFPPPSPPFLPFPTLSLSTHELAESPRAET